MSVPLYRHRPSSAGNVQNLCESYGGGRGRQVAQADENCRKACRLRMSL